MLYTDELLELDKDSYKKYRGTVVLKPKAFKQYSTQLEKEQQLYTNIIRNTKLKSVSPEDVDKRLQDNEDIVQVDYEEYYELQKAKSWPTAGYFHVGDNCFVRVQRRVFLLIIFILLLLGLGLGVDILFSRNPVPTSRPQSTFNPDIDPSANEYTGQLVQDLSEQESIVVPGFFKFTAVSGGSLVQLYNPEENTVYFQYEIYNVVNSNIVEQFDSEESALSYIQQNQIDYHSEIVDDRYVTYNDSGDELVTVPVYSCVYEDATYKVLQEDYSIVYVTRMIEPGKQVMWDTYESLDKGDYTLKFKVNTYDIDTGAKCYGAIQTVEGIVR